MTDMITLNADLLKLTLDTLGIREVASTLYEALTQAAHIGYSAGYQQAETDAGNVWGDGYDQGYADAGDTLKAYDEGYNHGFEDGQKYADEYDDLCGGPYTPPYTVEHGYPTEEELAEFEASFQSLVK